MTRRTQAERRAATTTAIIEAAGRRFVQDGLAAASLDDIASDAGVTKGAVYHYFASKDELVAAVLDRSPTNDPGSAIFRALSSDDRDKRLRAVGRAGARNVAPPEVVALRYDLWAAAMRSETVRAALARSYRRALEELAERYGDDASRRAIIVGSAMLEGLQLQRFLNADLVPESVFEDAIAALGAILDGSN